MNRAYLQTSLPYFEDFPLKQKLERRVTTHGVAHPFGMLGDIDMLGGIDMLENRHVTWLYLLVQLKPVPLTLNISFIHVEAAHLIFILHEELPICDAGSVLNVLEVLHPLHNISQP